MLNTWFMEAGKERLTCETVGDATRQEIVRLKRDNSEPKHLVAVLSLQVYRLKKTAIPMPDDALGTKRVSASQKAAVLAGVGSSSHLMRQVLRDQISKRDFNHHLGREDQLHCSTGPIY